MKYAPQTLAILATFAGLVSRAGEAEAVRGIKVVADRAPDCSTLRTIVDSVTRDCKTNDEKGIAVYNFMQLSHYHQGYPAEEGGLGALKEINVYGWSLCGGLHTIEAALWRELGWEWRYVGWSDPGHTTVEARYDGRWHYFDAFLKFYAWMPDPNAPGGRTIAGEDDLKANPALILENFELDPARAVYYRKGDRFEVLGGVANWKAPAFLCCGDTPQDMLKGLKNSSVSGSPTGWAGLEFDSPGYSTDIDFAPGGSLELTWDPISGASWWNGREYKPGHTCGDKDSRNCPSIGPIVEPYLAEGQGKRSFASGTLTLAPDLADPSALKAFAAFENAKIAGGKVVPIDASKPATITMELRSPYIMSRATGTAEGLDAADLSTDGGKTFRPIKLDDFSEQVGGKYACLVRLATKTALAAPKLSAIVQCNRGALPYLSPGKNRVTVTVADPKALGDRSLAITYAYRAGSRSQAFEELADAGAEIARAHHSSWSKTTTVVRKVFQAADLPATFEIDIPTPKSLEPAYPRMLFLRREVLSEGVSPLPLPEGSKPPEVSPGDSLKTLPNPFTIGIAPPPESAARATTTRTIALRRDRVISADGKALEDHYLKTKPGETWALLISGELKDLPPAREIAAARLVVPIRHGCDQSATRLGVCAVQAPIKEGEPYDFKAFGEPIGSTVVPKQPGEGDYRPAKAFSVDLTRSIKRIANEPGSFWGFAVRTIPDRSTDEGYITRLDVAHDAPIVLEVDVFGAK